MELPSVTLELDKPHRLTLSLGAMRRFMQATGQDPDAADLGTQFAPSQIGALVWACMSAEDRAEVSAEAVADMIGPANIDAVSAAIVELNEKSMPTAPEGKAPQPTPEMTASG